MVGGMVWVVVVGANVLSCCGPAVVRGRTVTVVASVGAGVIVGFRVVVVIVVLRVVVGWEELLIIIGAGGAREGRMTREELGMLVVVGARGKKGFHVGCRCCCCCCSADDGDGMETGDVVGDAFFFFFFPQGMKMVGGKLGTDIHVKGVVGLDVVVVLVGGSVGSRMIIGCCVRGDKSGVLGNGSFEGPSPDGERIREGTRDGEKDGTCSLFCCCVDGGSAGL